MLRLSYFGKNQVDRALPAGRQEPFQAEPQGDRISLLGQLGGFPRQCFALAIEQLFQKQRSFVAASTGRPEGFPLVPALQRPL